MTLTTDETLDQLCAEVFRGLNEHDQELVGSVVGRLKPVFHPQVIEPCVMKFTDAELDCVTPGKCGLGRASPFIPRLGAYYRGQTARLSTGERAALQTRIRHVLLAGYVTAAGVWEEEICEGYQKDPEELFRTWIPLIYVVQAWNSSPRVRELVDWFAKMSLDNLAQYMDKLGMRGGLFKSKRAVILLRYLNAGLLLRRCEILPENRALSAELLLASLRR